MPREQYTPFQRGILLIACAEPMSPNALIDLAGFSAGVSAARVKALQRLTEAGLLVAVQVNGRVRYAVTREGEEVANQIFDERAG